MARGPQSPAPKHHKALPQPVAALPVVEFTRVEEDASIQPAGVHDQQLRAFGYNDFSEYRRPERYIRYIEPLESDLMNQVEYDMDEQDQDWVDTLNTERKKDQLDKITYEFFEIVIDRLEKEWFNLTKNLPRPEMDLPSEDSTCAICEDSEGENMNAIVFCDGCNLAVHQDCYGVPYIPEGQWLCRKCTVSPENPVSCLLCPNEGGAFKQTVTGEWVHLLCAIWVPETRVGNDVFMEPITGVEKIPKNRWKLKCSVCDVRAGACIQCSKQSCFTAFHPTCARRERFLMPMKGAAGAEPGMLTSFCERHLPKEQQDQREAALAEREASDADANANLDESGMAIGSMTRSARAYAKTYRPGPPLVPIIIVRRILEYVRRISPRKREEVVLLICKYWSLKRESRRGAPLLKRLHLEPWTASRAGVKATEEEKVAKLNHMRSLVNDMQRIRDLIDLVRKREEAKLQQAESYNDLIASIFLKHESRLRMTFENVIRFDAHEIFRPPVSRIEAPDYYDVIARPMCWAMIDAKLDRHEYWDVRSFKEDVLLVLTNAMKYNKYDTKLYKAAARIRAKAKPILEALEEQLISPERPFEPSSAETLGPLEPTIDVLELLLSQQCSVIAEATDIVLDRHSDPLSALFAFELGKYRTPPPPPPKPKKERRSKLAGAKTAKGKRRRDYKAEKERAAANRLRREQEAAGISVEPLPDKNGDENETEMNEQAQKQMQDLLGATPGIRTRKSAATIEAALSGHTQNAEYSAVPSPSAKASGRGRSNQQDVPATIPMPDPKPQSGIPSFLPDVDNQQSFRHFESGWILPEGSRRGGRGPPTQREDLPPPKKRQKTMPQPDSNVDELTGIRSSDAGQGRDTSPEHVTDGALHVSTSTPPEDTRPKKRPAREKPPPKIVIDVVETPATRREKAARRKAERLAKQAAEAVTHHEAGAQEAQEAQSESELSELSELSGDDMDADEEWKEVPPPLLSGNAEKGGNNPQVAMAGAELNGRKDDGCDVEEQGEDEAEGEEEQDEPANEDAPLPVSAAALASKADTTQRGGIVLAEGEVLEGGTLVWAKSGSYPWWAAVIFQLPDSRVPANVVHTKSKTKLANVRGPLHLVQFYDPGNTWQWLDLTRLKLLGEDEELDQELINGNAKFGQRFKTKVQREQCRDSWRRAMREIETGQDEDEEAAGENADEAELDHGDDERVAAAPGVENKDTDMETALD